MLGILAKSIAGGERYIMNNPNREVDLVSYLTEEEQGLLAADRKIIIARTLVLQVRLLELYGSTESQIQDGVANMRAKFGDLSTESIQKIQESLGTHASVLMELQSARPAINIASESIPSLTVVHQPELKVEDSPLGLETVADMPAQLPTEAVTPVVELVEAEEPPIEIPEIDYDNRRPKDLPVAVNNLLNGIFTFEQRSALMRLDVEQRAALLRAFHETMEANSHRPKFVPVHTDRLDKLLGGMNIAEVADLEGQTTGAITSAFRNNVHDVLRSNRTDFMRKYMSYLGSTEIPSFTEERLTSDNKLHVLREKPSKQEIPRPDNMHALMNNLLSKFLNYEQREAIAGFNPAQVSELVALLDSVYEENAVRLEEKDRHIGRIESLMNGLEPRDIAAAEGGVQQIVIVQSFSKLLPGIFSPHKDRILKGLVSIQARETPTGTGIEEGVDTAEENNQTAHNGSEVIKELDTIVTSEETTKNEKVGEKIEPLVQRMQQLYNTSDPEALQGISDLFSVDETVASSESTGVASIYLADLIRAKGISLDMTIASPIARTIVSRLLYGMETAEGRQYSTLSEILAATPNEDARKLKREGVEKALNKIASTIEGSAAPRVDVMKQRAQHIRENLGKVLPSVADEQIEELLKLTQEKYVDYTPTLSRALIELLRKVKGMEPSELPEMGEMTIAAFTLPRNGEPAMSIPEIKKFLIRRYPEDEKKFENGFVADTIYATIEALIRKEAGEHTRV